MADGLDLLHTGKRTDARQQLSVERSRPRVIAVSSLWGRDAGRDDAF
jgi:hypothetical protein